MFSGVTTVAARTVEGAGGGLTGSDFSILCATDSATEDSAFRTSERSWVKELAHT
jgi:hypothetical protein